MFKNSEKNKCLKIVKKTNVFVLQRTHTDCHIYAKNTVKRGLTGFNAPYAL